MINTIEVINDIGEKLTMDLTRPEKSGFVIKSIDGLGPMKADVSTTQLATSDGSSYNSSKVQERYIKMDLEFSTRAKKSIEDIRHDSYRYFSTGKKVKYIVYTDRRICSIDGYIEQNEPDIFSEKEGCIVSIKCPYPYFKAYGENSVLETVFYSVEPLFEFPFSNESLTENLIEFGNILPQKDKNVLYDGDKETGMTIKIHTIGPVKNISIFSLKTNERIDILDDKFVDIVGSSIKASDDIIIKTYKGDKSMYLLRSGVYINILNALNKNVDWIQLRKGENTITYLADEGENNIQLTIETTKLYEGI